MQSDQEKKEARKRCQMNRLKLGQYNTQRQGATFVENWVDGFAFDELLKFVFKCVNLLFKDSIWTYFNCFLYILLTFLEIRY